MAVASRVRRPAWHDVVTTIDADRPRRIGDELRELLAYKDLLYFLVRRDIKTRYVQTVLGFGWAVVKPITTMLVFTLFFGTLANIPSSGLPYPVFALAALVLWNYFATALGAGASSLLGNVGVVRKVFFPRLLIPLSPMVAALVDFAISVVVLLCVMAVFGLYPTLLGIVLLPLFVLLALIAAAGVGMWLGALAVQYRDVRHATPFLVQLWMFFTPVIYPSSLVPDQFRLLYALNPMVGVTENFRAVFLQDGDLRFSSLALSFGVGLVLLVSGISYFRRVERYFADIA